MQHSEKVELDGKRHQSEPFTGWWLLIFSDIVDIAHLLLGWCSLWKNNSFCMGGESPSNWFLLVNRSNESFFVNGIRFESSPFNQPICLVTPCDQDVLPNSRWCKSEPTEQHAWSVYLAAPTRPVFRRGAAAPGRFLLNSCRWRWFSRIVIPMKSEWPGA